MGLEETDGGTEEPGARPYPSHEGLFIATSTMLGGPPEKAGQKVPNKNGLPGFSILRGTRFRTGTDPNPGPPAQDHVREESREDHGNAHLRQGIPASLSQAEDVSRPLSPHSGGRIWDPPGVCLSRASV